MQQNSFQKNGLLNINNNNSSNNYNTGNYGRRSIQDIRDDMYKAKTKPGSENNNQSNNLNNNKQPDHRKRVEEMRNFYRWK